MHACMHARVRAYMRMQSVYRWTKLLTSSMSILFSQTDRVSGEVNGLQEYVSFNWMKPSTSARPVCFYHHIFLTQTLYHSTPPHCCWLRRGHRNCLLNVVDPRFAKLARVTCTIRLSRYGSAGGRSIPIVSVPFSLPRETQFTATWLISSHWQHLPRHLCEWLINYLFAFVLVIVFSPLLLIHLFLSFAHLITACQLNLHLRYACDCVVPCVRACPGRTSESTLAFGFISMWAWGFIRLASNSFPAGHPYLPQWVWCWGSARCSH